VTTYFSLVFSLEEALLKVLPSLLPNHLGTTRGARVEFYDKFQREADEYDSDLLKKYGEDLGNTLIFVGAFSSRLDLNFCVKLVLSGDRPVYSLQSHPLSLSMFRTSLNRISKK
jgi:hypothetical protein